MNLNLLFYREGFSYCIEDEKNKRPKVIEYKLSNEADWEAGIIKELEINLNLRRNFNRVNAAFISSFFSLVPAEYSDVDKEQLLNFSEAEFDNNILLSNQTELGASFVYGISQLLEIKLNALYKQLSLNHSGNIFIGSLQKSDETLVHINLNHHQLEVAVTDASNLIFYNLFDTPTGEDILFYTLFVMEQLELDTNKTEIKTYGELLSDTKVFQILKKYVRHVSQALKDELYLKNFTIYNLSKCE